MLPGGIPMTGLRKTTSLKQGLSQLAPPDLRNAGNSSGSDEESDITVVPVGSPLNEEELAVQLENARRIVAQTEAKTSGGKPKTETPKAAPSPTASNQQESPPRSAEGVELTTPKGAPSPVSTRSSNASSRSSPPSTRSVVSLKDGGAPTPAKPASASSPVMILGQLQANAKDAAANAEISNPIPVPIADVKKTVGKLSSPDKPVPVAMNAEALNAARASGLQAKIKRGYATWWNRVVPVPGATDPLLNTTVVDGMLFPFDEEIDAYYRPSSK